MKGVAMNSTYKVYYKTDTGARSGAFETLAEFECDKARYLHEIDKAIKNGLSFSATDSLLANWDSSKVYELTIYIW